MALLQAPVVVADGSAAQLLVADVVASRDRVEATFSLDAELRQGFLLAGAAADRVDVEVALVTGTCNQISINCGEVRSLSLLAHNQEVMGSIPSTNNNFLTMICF